MLKNKSIKTLFVRIWVLCTIAIFVTSGCGNLGVKNSKERSTSKIASEAANNKVIYNKQAIWREVGTWPKPPLYQGNPFASGGVGAAYSFVFEPLFQFVRSTDKVYPRLAESLKDEGNKTIVTLKRGVTWNDGKPFTSKDVWAYYTLNNGTQVTAYLDKIETPDDYTVIFIWNNPMPYLKLRDLFIALDYMTIPYHIYGKYVDKANELLSQCKKATDINKRGPFGLEIDQKTSDELMKNWQEFLKDNPKYPIGTGPYIVKNVTASDMVLVKRDDYYNSKNVHFNTVTFKQVDPTSGLAMLKAGQLERFDSTPPKDMLESILNSNKDLVHYVMRGTGCTGTTFNLKKAPFNDVRFRRAVVFALDRNKIREAANYYAENYDISVSAIPPSTIEKEVLPEVQDKMTKFIYDPSKAEQLLKEIGWNKGSDGVWRDKNGKMYEFIIGATNTNLWFTNSSELVAEQLTKFGLPTKMQVVDPTVYYTNAQNGKYDMATDFTNITWSFLEPYFSLYNFYFGAAGKYAQFDYVRSGPQAGKLNLVLPGIDGKPVDIDKSIRGLPYIQDDNERKKVVSNLVWITNENAFGIVFFQNVTGTWGNLKTVSGWPWPDGIKKYNRNLPIPTDPDDIERIAETNIGFAGIQMLVDGTYSPK